jgi:hypothetical protein
LRDEDSASIKPHADAAHIFKNLQGWSAPRVQFLAAARGNFFLRLPGARDA